MTRDSDDYDPGFERPRRRAGNRSVVTIVVAIAVIIPVSMLLCCGGLGFWGWHLSSPDWYPFTPASGSYTAQFPQKPEKVTSRTDAGPDGRTYQLAECRYSFPPNIFAIRETALTPAEQKQPGETLRTTADSWASRPGHLETARTADPVPEPSLDLVLTRGDTTICLRLIIENGKLFILSVESTIYDETDDPVIDFFNHFAPTGKQ